MSPDKLVRMANQIAKFFESQPGSDQADRVAAHLSDFWDPSMRAALSVAAKAGDIGLSPLAAEAVRVLDTRAAAKRAS